MDDPEYHLLQLSEKGKRAQRREDEASHDPGHLRRSLPEDVLRYWYRTSLRDSRLYKLMMRSFRHSCHLAGCRHPEYEGDNRRDRHEIRAALRRYVDDDIAVD